MTLGRQRLIDVAADEADVLADAHAWQPPVLGVLQNGLGRDAAEKHTDVSCTLRDQAPPSDAARAKLGEHERPWRR